MRISDWSSDVCSSDLRRRVHEPRRPRRRPVCRLPVGEEPVTTVTPDIAAGRRRKRIDLKDFGILGGLLAIVVYLSLATTTFLKTGRESGRERVCQYV